MKSVLSIIVFISTLASNALATSDNFDEKAFEARVSAVAKRVELNFGSTNLLSNQQQRMISESLVQLVGIANSSYNNKCIADPVMHVLKRNYLNDLRKCVYDLSSSTEDSDSIYCSGLYTDYAGGFSAEEIPKLLNERKQQLQFIEKAIAQEKNKIKYFIELSASCETKVGDKNYSGGVGVKTFLVIDTQGNVNLSPNLEHFNDLENN